MNWFTTLIQPLINIIQSWLNYKNNQSVLENTKEIQDRERAKLDTEMKDQIDSLIKNVKDSDEQERQKALDEIRKKIS